MTRNANADMDTVYLIALDYHEAAQEAHERGLTGHGYGKGTGPRPWVYLRDALDLRGRTFGEHDVSYVAGWWLREDAGDMLAMLQLCVRL